MKKGTNLQTTLFSLFPAYICELRVYMKKRCLFTEACGQLGSELCVQGLPITHCVSEQTICAGNAIMFLSLMKSPVKSLHNSLGNFMKTAPVICSEHFLPGL